MIHIEAPAFCPYLAGGSSAKDRLDPGSASRVVERFYAALDAGDRAGALAHVTDEAFFEGTFGRAQGIRQVAHALSAEQSTPAETFRGLGDLATRWHRNDAVEVEATVVSHVRRDGRWDFADAFRARHVLRRLHGRWMITARVATRHEGVTLTAGNVTPGW